MDMLIESRRFYNVCRAKTGQTTTEHCNCGFAFPATMWNRTTGWTLYCDVDWTVLKQKKERQRDPNMTNPVTLWYNYMKEKHTANTD
eukprot:1369848-Prorocentrum_lima.AAC.1